MNPTITSNVDQLAPLMEKIRGEYHDRGAARAANRTRDKVLTQTRRALSNDYGIPAAAVARKRVFKAASASPRRPRAIIKVGQWPVPVDKFGTPRQIKKGGVSYKTVGGSVTDRDAFLVPSIGPRVFKRAPGAGRLPIKTITADIAEPVEKVLTRVAGDENVGAIFRAEYESTMKYRVDQELAKWRRAT